MSQPTYEQTASRGWLTRFLDAVERLENLLPHPVTLFALGVVFLSGVAGWFDLSVTDPRPEGARGRSPTGEIVAISLMNGDGLRRIMENLVTNFTSFVPMLMIVGYSPEVIRARRAGRGTAAALLQLPSAIPWCQRRITSSTGFPWGV